MPRYAICKKSYHKQFTKGKVYKLREKQLSAPYVAIEKDDCGQQNGHTTFFLKILKTNVSDKKLFKLLYA